MKLTEISIKRPVATIVLMLTALILGIYGYFQMPIDFCRTSPTR